MAHVDDAYRRKANRQNIIIFDCNSAINARGVESFAQSQFAFGTGCRIVDHLAFSARHL